MTRYFIDHDSITSTINAQATFTNGSDKVVIAGNQSGVIKVGGYIRSTATTSDWGVEWYKVTAVNASATSTTVTIDHAFYQGSHTADGVYYNKNCLLYTSPSPRDRG